MKLFTIGRYTFAPKIIWIIATLLMIYLLSSLGFWQLHRADEKRALLKQHARMSQTAPIDIQTIQNFSSFKIQPDQPITVTGTYDTQHIFFLDNQFYQQLACEVHSNSHKLLLQL